MALSFGCLQTARATQPRQLTLAERVAYQYAIEEVYWRHRIWPKENPGPKPSLDEAKSQAQIEKKVEDYLRNSQALEDHWQRPITPEQLQAQVDRMASHTRQPDVLRELFAALRNDPFLIAECLARPILADRLMASSAVVAGVSPAPSNSFAAATAASTGKNSTAYKLPEISVPLDCAGDTWTPTTLTNAPSPRSGHTAIWTGSEMIVWGGQSTAGSDLNTGGRYNPSTDSWIATSIMNAPSPRSSHTAIWTGSEMIVWGGNNPSYLNTGGRYNPGANSWTATSTTNAPSQRAYHTAVWSGSEMVVWGGSFFDGTNHSFNTGGRYNPITNSWIATSTTNAPTGRDRHTAVWTGSQMIVWGGYDVGYSNTGGRYNPSTDSWTATSTTNAPTGRYSHTAVWTGSEMIVWGGLDVNLVYLNTGGRYNPSTDSWAATGTTNAAARGFHTAVWTGSEMIVWGGYDNGPIYLNTGGKYNPSTDGWTATSTTNAPAGRTSPTAVWEGGEMIVWGGSGSNPPVHLNTGGRYCAPSTPTLGIYPDTSIPLSANATVTPSAAPANTTSINVSCSTNFKGRLEGYPLTGVVRVTDAHPAGTYTVTVRAFDSAGASVTKTFTLTVTTPATCTPVRFAAANFAASSQPNAVAVGDFNGDGNQDLAIANYGSNNVSILLGDGSGNFSAPTNFTVGSGPTSVAVGDFNGDGNQDLAVANNFSPNTVSILLGNGAGSFSAATNFGVGLDPYSVAVGDFNGDGKQDLAVATPGSSDVSILLGNGAGSFSAATNFAVGSGPVSVAVGDFNGDGNQDLAVANNGSNTVSILLGNGAGQFSAAVSFDAGINPFSVAVGDFNSDGRQDLVVANNGSNNVSILLGDGSGNFSAPTNFTVGSAPISVGVGDFDGDGKQDLAVANASNRVSILLGNGSGGFNAPTNFGAGSQPYSVAVGDFNGDGKQDLAVANTNSGNVTVLLRVCALAPTGAVSRKMHGSSGTFDLNLPLTGSSGIECRTSGGTNDYTMIVNFSGAVTVAANPQAQVTSGTGCVGSAGTCSTNGTVTISANTVSIPLTNIGNAQTISVTLNNVSGGIGNVVIPMSILAGDMNGTGAVNAGDIVGTKTRLGQPVNATNFRADVNANGSINGTDVSIVKSYTGTGLPTPPY